MRLLHLALAVAALGGSPAEAQRCPDGNPSVPNLIDQLQPGMRGVRMPGDPPPATAPALSRATTAPAGRPAASISIRFGTGLAVLTSAAELAPDELGHALASRQVSPCRLRIERHPDTAGGSGLNQPRSERRAVAARDCPAARHGISPGRLDAAGFGENQLLVTVPDEAAEARNRRVQVINLGG